MISGTEPSPGRPFRRFTVLVALGVALTFSATRAWAQVDVDSLRRELRLPQPATFAADARGRWVSPALSIGVPSGFGADFGDAFAGLSFQHRTRTFEGPDGGAVVGFGLGDAQELVGLEVALTSYGTVNSCCRGALSLKLHRTLPQDASLAVGLENGVLWGVSDAGTSFYGVGSKLFVLRSDPAQFLGTLSISLGAGNGRFRTREQLIQGEKAVSPFGSIGVRLAPRASGVASWTGQDLVAGVSIVPLRNTPLFITPAVADLTTKPRFIMGAGYGFNFGTLF